jgi:hypothetical protein
MDKHSSLLRTFVNYSRKKFYNTGPRSIQGEEPDQQPAEDGRPEEDGGEQKPETGKRRDR